MDARKINILVVEYDHCLFTVNGTSPQMLSKPIIDFVRDRREIVEFYGCTHRSYARLAELKNKAKEELLSTTYSQQDLLDNFSTFTITHHFQTAVSLTCLGVSTLDDLVLEECGAGYTKVIAPYEKSNGKTKPEEDAELFLPAKFKAQKDTKNPQLLQIAQQVARLYSGAEITLTYLDTEKKVCKSAREACQQKRWPSNVSIEIYQHAAENDRSPVEHIGTAKPKTKKKSDLQVVGSFALGTSPYSDPSAGPLLKPGSGI